MVIFTTPAGPRLGLNPDLIESAVCGGSGTVIRLVDGREHAVNEMLDVVAERMLAYRMAVVDGAAPTKADEHRPTVLQLLRTDLAPTRH